MRSPLEFLDEQNSPQAIGVVQHQTPDTTSPSPPHPYASNGNFPSVVHPPGKIICFITIGMKFLCLVQMDQFLTGLPHQQIHVGHS